MFRFAPLRHPLPSPRFLAALMASARAVVPFDDALAAKLYREGERLAKKRDIMIQDRGYDARRFVRATDAKEEEDIHRSMRKKKLTIEEMNEMFPTKGRDCWWMQ